MRYAEKHDIPVKDGKYDKDVYNELYNKVREKILKEHADAYNDFWRLPDLCKNARAAAAKDAPAASAQDAPTDPDLEQ